MSIWDAALALLALPGTLASLYLGFLALMARRPPIPAPAVRAWKFDIIVPAHNEELGIADTVTSLRALDYPEAQRAIWVVADNCSDDTAARAEAAGALVLVRNDTEKRGKGYALDYAFSESQKRGFADAVVVIDADTQVTPNLLAVLAARLEAGAAAIQVSYGVSNPRASWRTRLMTLALALFNDLRSLGRERMGWSAGLRGNGMCFTHALLREVPHRAYSLVEDLEFGIRLGRAGHRVEYTPEAQVRGEMVSSEKASRSQRRRWEGGRWQLAKTHAASLVRAGLAQRKGLLLDLGLDLLVPPLSYLVLGMGLLTVAAVVATWLGNTTLAVSLALTFTGCSALIFYVMRGWAISGVGPRGLLDLLWAPVFVVWKLALLLTRSEHGRNEWVRTTREEESRTHGR